MFPLMSTMPGRLEPGRRLPPPVTSRLLGGSASPPQVSSVSGWGVRAGVSIPAMTSAGPYPPDVPLGATTADNPKSDKFIDVKVKDGMMVPDPEAEMPCHWLLCVTPARDRHEQNLEAVRDARGLVFFRTVKEIRRGEELLVWYSAELALECGIPILTPAHIRSDQEYACTGCDVSFRYPNSLKAHIRFHCARSSMTSWFGQYPSLQTGALLSAYQQELSKYFSHLGTLWNLRKMAAAEQVSSRLSGDLSPPASSHDMRSAFRPCASTMTAMSAAFTPSQSPLSSAARLSERTSPRNSPLAESRGSKCGTPEENLSSKSGSSPVGRYPGIPGLSPNYLDKFYLYNYAQLLRSDMSQLPPELAAAGLQRLPVPMGMEYTPATSRDSAMLARNMTPSSIGYPDNLSHRDGMGSPDSDRDTPPKMPIAGVSFPMPSETAGEPIDLLPKSLYMSKAYKGHLCIYCGKLYSRKYGLKIHLRTHTGYKPLKCKVCLRPFGDPSNLNKHIRLHAEGETPYRCDFCGKVLVRRRDLERHIKSRHPQHAEDIAGIASIPGITDITDNKSDKLGDADSSFIDVDIDIDVDVDDDDDDDDCTEAGLSPLSLTTRDINVT